MAGFSSFDGEYSLPHVLAQGSPIFHLSFKGELGIALQSLQGKIDIIYACVQDLVFHYCADRDLGVAYQTHPGNQASSRGEAKNSAVLLSRDGYLLEPTVCPKGSQAS